MPSRAATTWSRSRVDGAESRHRPSARLKAAVAAPTTTELALRTLEALPLRRHARLGRIQYRWPADARPRLIQPHPVDFARATRKLDRVILRTLRDQVPASHHRLTPQPAHGRSARLNPRLVRREGVIARILRQPRLGGLWEDYLRTISSSVGTAFTTNAIEAGRERHAHELADTRSPPSARSGRLDVRWPR